MKNLLWLPWLDRLSAGGPFLLRLAVGGAMVIHGSQKLFGDPGRFIGFVEKLGFPLPTVFGWAAIAAEFLGGLALVLGLATRWAAVFVAFTMGVAAFIAHANDGFNKQEYPLVLMLGALSLLLSGAGAWSLDARLSRSSKVN
ncbi:DoxX family protein [Chloracidobacterium aggregatum]|uniref:DoxX family protein n=1 Tax=Chloracidobacterium sp. N TaxID=2821540 RepID=A0ABX8AZI1_9BACT|nr:DoxX family protein [Chloracidobacterium aggregatum]QUV83995.1 DoxX family protein [Chloracidobacterium sp. 2]QUV87520.1 DoxX family protein [Chloracidobacterium sp. S]QUV90420.1 DoxX family protein [Chloracidobacterium sp. A]QUV93633.1 DoxX family protein [Chloracidobacterium sp. N]QUV96788.1 DoxX family protein [Chloracidobacterium sp. E]